MYVFECVLANVFIAKVSVHVHTTTVQLRKKDMCGVAGEVVPCLLVCYLTRMTDNDARRDGRHGWGMDVPVCPFPWSDLKIGTSSLNLLVFPQKIMASIARIHRFICTLPCILEYIGMFTYDMHPISSDPQLNHCSFSFYPPTHLINHYVLYFFVFHLHLHLFFLCLLRLVVVVHRTHTHTHIRPFIPLRPKLNTKPFY